MKSLTELRKKVKDNDAKMVQLLKTRMELTEEIGAEKKKSGTGVKDTGVEKEVMENALALANKNELSPAMVEAVMQAVISESCLQQEAVLGKSTKPRDTENANIADFRYLPPPMEFRTSVPLSKKAAGTVKAGRSAIRKILDGRDMRTIVIAGPCSIHDMTQAEEFAEKMAELKKKVDDKFLLVMRVYVEKSRTGKGWTGFLTDPYLDGTGNAQDGINMTRKFLVKLAELGVPTATEFINTATPRYIGDLISWAAIGACSSGSQTHRDMASGLSMPVGFKNGPDGGIGVALGAVESAGQGHTYLGADDSGTIRAFRTKGNKHCHIVLRGGERPNCSEKGIRSAQNAMKAAGLQPGLIVDCSHGNSGKLARNQVKVFKSVMELKAAGNRHIIGAMLESHLNSGNQPLPEVPDISSLRYGVSVTDECIGWKSTERIILEAYDKMK
ncbi:MAG: 3-deoxy-7-phosphoheptulonate synthase [Candidatus Thermoplasmatota archaeon]|nr:3-deoxy-7-phosphoheptulonate synthase [Candidatus Thermoplasmatota archaeon]MBU4070560.1 3-deoxy-7-phosphoheptulonate synthase [Candidatus Thermoplasmatota archaeon]MBU4144702.1 3-deoxy-7-phosphoheptulonate synthase [Candidatus Thermoplasmatota archaeon]MBU4592681.1 3-deoxy-7-phosphoheptulonate synthase [Candidatus Thermoplasmatota archaeon]